MGLSWAAARTTRLKIGPGVLVLPGRNPAVVAKQLASLDRLSAGRLLVAFGLGLPDPTERAAFPIPPGLTRGQAFDEAFALVRRYLDGEAIDGVRVQPEPVQQPLDLWVGGSAPAALVRAGRMADGWLPSLITPDEAAEGRALIEQEAERAGRRVDPEHFGVSLTYLDAGNGKSRSPTSCWRRSPADGRGSTRPSSSPRASTGRSGASGSSSPPASRSSSCGPAARPGTSTTATLEAMAEALLPLQPEIQGHGSSW